ncbi:MAG: 30S ribosomal protein S17 [Planctomycetes bacterium]|nr:30S ribosomal protein S17 [Planctomycetota bacterium]
MATEAKTPAPRDLTGTKIGVVTSDKRDKTRAVAVDFQVRHPKYGKYLKRSTVFHVHDEKNESKLGDRVEIANCRPISKTKSWRLIKVVERTAGQLEHKTEIETK